MPSPNIVYLMFDQAKASAMSFMGNNEIDMPFCDMLAQSGWVFDHAYAPAPICTPSRASVHTGLYPQVHGATCHQNRAPSNIPQLAELMQAGGYYTAAAGHYEPERNLCRGWHEQSPMHERGPLYTSWKEHISLGRKDVAWSSGAIPTDAKNGNSALLTDRALRMLDQAENSGQPFFLHLCYDDPHPPYFAPWPYDTMFDPDSLTLPEIGNLSDLPDWHHQARLDVGTQLASEQDFRNVLAVYYGMIRYIDDEMARIYAALEAKGLLENTWIILGSDHGDYTGEKGLFNKSESLYKCLLHVPLVIVAPKESGEIEPHRNSSLVSSVDLFPTILGIAGLIAPTNQGKNIVSWVRSGSEQPLHEVVFAQVGDYHGFIETSWPSGMPASGRHKNLTHAIRNKTHAYINDPDNGDEAYNLAQDPHELVNLANQYKDPLPPEFDVLRTQLRTFQNECAVLQNERAVIPGDRGFVEGWE